MVARTADWTVAQTVYSKESLLVGWMAVSKAERMAASSVARMVVCWAASLVGWMGDCAAEMKVWRWAASWVLILAD